MNQCISQLLNQSFIYMCKCDTVGDGDSESTQTIILFMKQARQLKKSVNGQTTHSELRYDSILVMWNRCIVSTPNAIFVMKWPETV